MRLLAVNSYDNNANAAGVKNRTSRKYSSNVLYFVITSISLQAF